MDAARAADSYLRATAIGRRHWRVGLLDVYLVRGVWRALLPVLFAVGTALLLERALRLIHELAASGSDIGYLAPLLLQLVPYYLELSIPLAFMVALALLVARLDRDLELEALLAGGVSLARIAAPLVALGLGLAALALFVGGWLEPHGRYGYRALRIEAFNAGRISTLQPGPLLQPARNLVLTFDRRLADGGAGEVFLWQRLDNGDELVVSGGAARIGFSPEDRLLGIDFSSGRYLAEQAGREPVDFDFEQLAFRQVLEPRDATWARGWDQKELTLPELAAEARSAARGLPERAVEAELYGRISRAVIIPLVPLLVLPLAIATKRRGRALGVLACAAFLALAHHGLNLARNLALAGAADPPLVTLGSAALLWLLAGALFVSARMLPSHSPLHALLEAVSSAPSRFLPHERRRVDGSGHSLAGYVAWELGKWTAIVLVTAVAFLQLVDLVDQGDEFAERGMGLREVARYAALQLPAIVQQAMPIAALAGAMVAFALFAGGREMTAIRAAGVSQWRVLAMALPVPLLLVAATFGLAEWVTPPSQLRLAAWWNAMEPPVEPADRARWFRIEDRIVRAGSAAQDGAALDDVAIFARDARGRLEERVQAERAVFSASGWTLLVVETLRLGDGGMERARGEQMWWSTPLRPEDVAAFFSPAPTLSATAAQRSLEASAPVNLASSVFETRLHRSAAEPLAPLVMLLFALPLAFIPPRTARSWPALLYAAAGGLTYLVADGVLTVAGQVGYVPSALGAWGAPSIAASIGLGVLVFSER
jgi:LPS export ABC transporter permease LptG